MQSVSQKQRKKEKAEDDGVQKAKLNIIYIHPRHAKGSKAARQRY